MSGTVTVRAVDPRADRDLVMRVLADSLAEAADPDRYEWAYLSNPAGVAQVWLAEDETGQPVGTSAGFPREFRIDGVIHRGLVLSDFAVHKSHRSLGPALKLLRATLGAIDDGYFAFALDYPSDTMRGVYQRLGGEQLGTLTRCVRVASAGAVLRERLGGGAVAKAVAAIPLAVESAWRAVAKVRAGISLGFDGSVLAETDLRVGDTAVAGVRSRDYLSWRYQYSGRFRAWTVADSAGRHNVAIVQDQSPGRWRIVELLGGQAGAEPGFLDTLARAAAANGCSFLEASALKGSPWHTLLLARGFREREAVDGPILYIRDSLVDAERLLDPSNWWMTDGDRDG